MKMKEGKKLQIPTTLVYQEGREPREMAGLSAVNELITMYEHSQDELRVICSSCPEHCEVIASVAGTAQNYIGELEQKLAETRDVMGRITLSYKFGSLQDIDKAIMHADTYLSARANP